MNSAGPLDPALDRLLDACTRRLSRELGIEIPQRRWPELARAVREVADEPGADDTHDLRARLERLATGEADPAAMEALAQRLTVGETYFFRDPAVFAALREHVLPPLVRARAEAGARWLRVWSAGCSTGEEAYSLAITLQDCVPDRERWRITVLASDLNRRALAAARLGIYPEWSFRATPAAVRARHFQRQPDGCFRIDERLRAMVRFMPLNLAEDVYPAIANDTAAMDLVFCRNVLMYLEPTHVRSVVTRLERSLNDGGWLAVGAVEVALVSAPSLVGERLPGGLLFRKRALGTSGATPAPVPGVARRASTAPSSAAPAGDPPAGGDGVQALEQRLARSPGDTDAMLRLARALADAGRLDRALTLSERLVARRPLDPLPSFLRGSILLESGHLDAAAAAFRRSLYLDHEFALAHFALAHVFAAQSRSAEAARHYRQARERLRELPANRPLPEADGLSAGQLVASIDALLGADADQEAGR